MSSCQLGSGKTGREGEREGGGVERERERGKEREKEREEGERESEREREGGGKKEIATHENSICDIGRLLF